MPRAMREMLQNGRSVDEPDRMPENITITNLDIIMYVVAIVGHFVDLGVDINIAVRYYLAGTITPFALTLVFILLPALVNTAVSIRMYSQDKQQDSITNEFTKRHWLRIFILVLQMAPILRFTDALIYAIKSRRSANQKDVSSQRLYYRLMLKEDSDAALLRIFECFLEAAPQQLLQMTLLIRLGGQFSDHQILSICSSIVGMGWCLAAYQRAVRFAQQDKLNMNWLGTVLQTLWHFLVTLSRITSLTVIACLFPFWMVLACLIHILVMTLWLQLFDRSPFCSQNKMAEVAFSFALGAVYLFTYILPIEGRTRYRYLVYYTICGIENVVCALIWCFYVKEGSTGSVYFYPLLLLCIVPFVLGIAFMLIYYGFVHPRVRKGVRDFTVSFKVNGQRTEVSKPDLEDSK